MGVTPQQQFALDIVNDARDLYTVAAKARAHWQTYFDVFSAEVNALDTNDTVLPGTDVTKAQIINMITMLENVLNFHDGNAVTQGAYHTTINVTRLKNGVDEP